MKKFNRITKWGPVPCPVLDYDETASESVCEKCPYDGGANEWEQFCQHGIDDYPQDPDDVEYRAAKTEG